VAVGTGSLGPRCCRSPHVPGTYCALACGPILSRGCAVTLLPGKHKIIILDEADSMTKGAQQVRRPRVRAQLLFHCGEISAL
jgi:DNA polymerase III delta prime subunit